MVSNAMLKNGTEFLMVTLVALIFISNNCDAKQQIRLQSGLDCSIPGYYRDVQNCKKFYYCPYAMPEGEGPSKLTEDDKQALHEFTVKGLECPEGAFFDESVSQCERYVLAKYIPVECKESHSGVREPSPYNEGVKTGVVQEMSNNHQ